MSDIVAQLSDNTRSVADLFERFASGHRFSDASTECPTKPAAGPLALASCRLARGRYSCRAYNVAVVKPQPQNDSAHKQSRRAIYATETSGLLLIAFLLLVLTLVRYWHVIHWSWR
jgi:hypothetical protein